MKTDNAKSGYNESQNENKFDEILERLNILDSLDRRLSNLEEDFKRFDRRLKDIENDQRTSTSIARATRGMKFFEKMPYELQGNSFTEDIKDYY